MTEVDVLIPTRNRPVELATTLAGLAAQDFPDFGVIVSDQSDHAPSYATAPAHSVARVLGRRGRHVRLESHRPPRGMAEHRCHLLAQSRARYTLFLDDDVWLEPTTISRLHSAITELRCGLVGCAVQGLSYLDDHRPEELSPFERWPGRPEPERIVPGDRAWQRWTLHNAANPTHLGDAVAAEAEWVPYKVAWIGGCVLYDRRVLLETGGFDFWTELPPRHCGEDVLAQLRVLAHSGGAGILPSGAVHLESPTTIEERPVEAFEIVPPDHFPSDAVRGSSTARS
ncbi:glycosyltransferase [Nocardia otitidiscaviarum]|uniref:glycosyltransferase n=1 Tax=Nocardia otitidiscaviarum TaxID=1823 RepID=UPI0005B8E4B7|nr:glycosyltransferase family 2 protein [Nocardia otitidiscaviarum]MBF6135179.1 glycosyltransferase [Nocardia otitidiscaviarum]MBF6487000.1 glycosyltransferase [Nocardia otitidiscaviarum]